MTVFDDAVRFAAEKHAGMTRKLAGTPYILHPLEVAVIAGTMTSDCEVLAAAVLHDTVEDTDTTLEEIEQRFGPRVAALVASETEDKHPQMHPEASWMMRKEDSLKELAEAEDPAVRILWLSDKLSNMRSLYQAKKEKGAVMWQVFHQKDPAMHAWYYRSIEALLKDMDCFEAMQEFRWLVGALFTEE